MTSQASSVVAMGPARRFELRLRAANAGNASVRRFSTCIRARRSDGSVCAACCVLWISWSSSPRVGGSEGSVNHISQDLGRGRPTEVGYLNGLIAKKGRTLGIPTPACDAVVAIFDELERGRLQPALQNLDLLRARFESVPQANR